MSLHVWIACAVAILLLAAISCKPTQPPTNWFREDGTINWEAEKEQRGIPTTEIVIHHTSREPGMSWLELSELQRVSLYVPRFVPSIPEPHIPEGTPVQSGHFRNTDGRPVEVFYAYHWLVRADGVAIRLLNDGEVGWHSGNWDENMRSIALCLDGDFSNTTPSKRALSTCAHFIAGYARSLHITRILGHCEVVKTECPGAWFLNGGKEELYRLSGLEPQP